MIDLDLIGTLVAVERAGSMTAAARALGLSQAAVSKRVHALESALGRRVFVRVGRGGQVTDVGRALVARMGPLVDELAELWAAERSDAGQLDGLLALGGPAELLSELVLPALAPLLAQGLRLRCRFGSPEQLLELLVEGGLDLVISTLRRPRRGIELRPWVEESFVLVGAPRMQDRLRGGAAITDLPVAAWDAGAPIVRRFWREALGASGPTRLAVTAPDLRAVRELVRVGAAVSVLPTYLVHAALTAGTLVDLGGGRRPSANRLWLALGRGRADLRARRVAEWLEQNGGALAARM